MPSTRFDVLIVGAGPAGGAAADALAGADGLRLGVIDQARLPRHKACGGVFAERILPALNDRAAATVERRVHTLAHTNRGDRPVELQGAVCAVDRKTFDQAILDGAAARAGGGLRVLGGRRVESVQETAQDVTVTTKTGERLSARVLIGADGAFSRVARATGLNGGALVRPAIDVEIAVPDRDFARFQDRLTLDLFEIADGYGWVFPKRETLSCGIVSWSPSQRLKAALGDYLGRRFAGGYRLVRQLGHGIPIYSSHKPIATRRVLLAGDAANLAEPIYGAGIEAAIESGRLAGETARAILDDDAAADRLSEAYQAQIHDRFGAPTAAVANFVSPIFRDRPDYFYDTFIGGRISFEAFAARMASVKVRPALGGA